MKIGILTYTKEYKNLGTNMQCYCTLKAVQAAYPQADVELIDYSAAAPSVAPYLSQVSLRSLTNDVCRIRKYNAFFKEHLVFSRESLVTPDVSQALDFVKRQRYDAIYVGSDTVLEMKGSGKDCLTPYWLDSTIPGVKMFAAASSHNITADALSSRQKCLMARALDTFSLMGVRDHATFRLLSQFAGSEDKRLELIPDPTFTYDIDYSHIEHYFAKRKLRLKAPVVCLHLLRDSQWAPALADRFRKAGYLVASLRPAHYADILFTDLSPFEQLGLYSRFSLVITHRFHDAIFCLKNLTPVIAFPEHVSDVTAHGESKIATLLKAFGADTTNYIPNKETLTADHLFERHAAAISHFAENRDRIQSVLLAHRARYTDFIQRSAGLVQ
jgi:hypothetical protein